MAAPDDQEVPDVDQLARSMLLLLGDHHDHQESSEQHHGRQPWSKSRDFTNDPQRGAAVRQASLADRERYLTAGLQPVDCRFCHVTVTVKQLGPGHTAVQWNTEQHSGALISPKSGDPAGIPRAPRPALR